MSLDVIVTPAAQKFMRRIVRFGGVAEAGFRLNVSPGGCSGFNASFGPEAAQPDDAVVPLDDGLRLLLPPASAALLQGVTIDFADASIEGGLRFTDPKATSCGCSSSAKTSAIGTAAQTASISLASIGKRKAGAPVG